MHRESLSIFESYKIIKEQSGEMTTELKNVITALKGSSKLTPAIKDAVIRVMQSPEFLADMDRVNKQSGQASYGDEYAKIKAQQDKEAGEMVRQANIPGVHKPQVTTLSGEPTSVY